MNLTGITIALPLPPPQPTQQAFFLFIFTAFIARTLFKQMDQQIQQTDWFKNLNWWWSWWIKRILDCLHHWYIGWALMVYAERLPPWIPFSVVEIYWIGFAILLDDLPDLPTRIRAMFKNYAILVRHDPEPTEPVT